MLKNFLAAALSSLAVIAVSLPAKATEKQTYYFTYNAIATSENEIYNDERFRSYILQWLKMDKSYPDGVAKDFCSYKWSGGSTNDFVKLKVSKLVQTSLLDGWSESRRKAYFNITGVSIVAGVKYYCPEYLNNFGDDDI